MDLISRERLIDEVVKIAKTSESDWRGVKFSAREIKFLIELQKPIESRPKGKWIEYWFQENVIAGVKCSNCNSVPMMNLKKKWNFCPNCGADMRGEE